MLKCGEKLLAVRCQICKIAIVIRNIKSGLSGYYLRTEVLEAAAVASLLLLPLWLLLERKMLHCCASVECVYLFVKRETVRRLA